MLEDVLICLFLLFDAGISSNCDKGVNICVPCSLRWVYSIKVEKFTRLYVLSPVTFDWLVTIEFM